MQMQSTRFGMRTARLVAAAILTLSANSMARSQTAFSVIYTFTGGTDGGQPSSAPLFQDSAGVLYGTSPSFGAHRQGVVFSVVPATGVETPLYAFTGGADGGQPIGSVVRDAKGNFYGTTAFDGVGGGGLVFELSPGGEETVLHNFFVSSISSNPFTGLTADSSGKLYGTTFGSGTVFKIDASGFTQLAVFEGGPNDGFEPDSNLLADASGNLYGTTSAGGRNFVGVLFKVTPAGDKTILHDFLGAPNDGGSPQNSGLIVDGSGDLYGVATNGGTAGNGVVYKFTAAGAYSIVYNFPGGAKGGLPMGKLLIDPGTGSLYGTTLRGGNNNVNCSSNGCGVVFRLNPSTGEETRAGGAPPFALCCAVRLRARTAAATRNRFGRRGA